MRDEAYALAKHLMSNGPKAQFEKCKAEKLEMLDRIESEYQREYLGQNQGQLYRSIINQLRQELEGGESKEEESSEQP